MDARTILPVDNGYPDRARGERRAGHGRVGAIGYPPRIRGGTASPIRAAARLD